jgi:hypothetical protein
MKPADPHNVEAHTQAHRDAIDSLMDRIAKACQKQPEAKTPEPGIGSRTHKHYPDLRWGR